jgi:hypothetical protein
VASAEPGLRSRRVNRILGALLVLCIAVPAVALAADTDPKKRITTADQARARSIVLKLSDLSAGWKKVPPPPERDLTCPGFNPDESDLTLTGESEAVFEHPQGLLIGSYSEVFATKDDALKSWTRSDKPGTARCLGYFFRQDFTQKGTAVKIVSAGRMAFPKLAPRTTAFKVVARMTITQDGKTGTVPITLQLIAFGQGRGDTSMIAVTPGTGIPMAELRALGKVLAARLVAAKL